jgi:hypothetical protein
MPDQPDDPIHYEMKIPPETKQSKHEHESDKPESGDSIPESETAKDVNVVRGDDKSQSARHSR